MNTIFERLKFALKFISMMILFGFITIVTYMLTPLWILIWLLTGKFYTFSILNHIFVLTLSPIIEQMADNDIINGEDEN